MAEVASESRWYDAIVISAQTRMKRCAMRALYSAMVNITGLHAGPLSCTRLFITVVILTGGCLSAVLAQIRVMG